MTKRRALRVDDLWAIPVLADPRLSPDGRLVAYVVTTADRDGDGYTSAIWLVPTDGSVRAWQLTPGPHDVSPRWSPDGRQLAFVTSPPGQPARLSVMPASGGEVSALADFDGGVEDPQWSPDGRLLAITSMTRADADRAAHSPVVVSTIPYKVDGHGLLNQRRSDAYVVDAQSGETTPLTHGPLSVSQLRWSPDGAVLACTTTTSAGDLARTSSICLLPSTGGELVPITPPDSRFRAATWSADGRELVVCGQATPRFAHEALFVVRREGGGLQPVAELDRNVMLGSPGYPGGLPAVNADGSVLFMARDEGSTQLYVAPRDAKPRRLVGGWRRSLSGLSVAAGLAAFVMADGTTNGELCVASVDGTGLRRLTTHFDDALPEVSLPQAEARLFTAPDGTTIQGWVLRAAGTTGASPLLLDVHGGPHNAWSPAFDGVHLYHQELVSRGWTVLLVNPRGSDGYGEEFYIAAQGAWGYKDEDDFLVAVDTLVAEGVVDETQVVVTGYSYGGYMSCWLSARYPTRWAAVAAGGVVTDLAMFAGTADLGTVMAELELGGLPWSAARTDLTASSPVTHVSQVAAPTLLLHGEADDRCPVSQAELWFAALLTREVPVTLVRYPGASHAFMLNGRPSHRVDWCRRIADFACEYVARRIEQRPSSAT